MKRMITASKIVLVGFFLTVSLFVLYATLTQPTKSPKVIAVEEETTIKNLRFYHLLADRVCRHRHGAAGHGCAGGCQQEERV